ncbi:MAG: hypothetical protein L0I76_16660 [Pseudonocardia sp.]|nr:hypothetical protein [Pseudonocardia sp.]
MALSNLMLGTWIFLGLITAWRILAVVRTPTPTSGRIAVAALFGTAFVSNTFNREAVADLLDQVRLGLAAVLSYIALIFFFSGFIYFFASGIALRDSWLTSLRVQALVPTAFSVLLVTAWMLTPPPDGLPLFDQLGSQVSAWPYATHLIIQVYMFYGTIGSTVLAWKAGQGRPRDWQWTFRTCSIGMGMCAIGGPMMRTPALIGLWLHERDFGPTFDMVRIALNFLGIVTLLVGLSLVAARTSLTRFRSLMVIKRRFLTLRPLWKLLYEIYPAIALYPSRSFIGELLLFGPSLRYRYRRRAIECRDGLWRLSPHVVDDDGGDEPLDIEQQARLVLDAVDRSRRGEGPLARAVAIAAPADHDERGDADADALVALANAIRRRRSVGSGSRGDRRGSPRPSPTGLANR